MRKFLLVLAGLAGVVALALGGASLAKASSEASTAAALRGQVSALRSDVSGLRSDVSGLKSSLRTTASALASARSELAAVRSEAAKTSKGLELGYCVQYFSPQDGNLVSYNATTGNDDYTYVFGLVENISTPQLQNGVWECPSGGTFVALAQ